MSEKTVLKLPEYVCRTLCRLEESGYEAYAVGGCVRDLLICRTPGDYDICTSALPEEIIDCFKGMKVIPTGIKHGTVTLIDEQPLEITTFRTDGEYSDGRHPDNVSFIRDISGDLARRDFTINAMAYSPRRGLVDLFCGRKDLERGLIRAVGDPVQRFHEDALRILRALRFSAVFGYEIEPSTAKAAREGRGALSAVSMERINAEFTKLICGANASSVLRKYPEIIEVFIPEIAPAIGFKQHNPHHHLDVWEHILTVIDASRPDPVIRYSALIHDLGKPACFTLDNNGVGHFRGHPAVGEKIAEKVLRRLRCDNRTIKSVCAVVRNHDNYFYGGRIEMREYIAGMGVELAGLILEFRVYDSLAQSPETRDEKIDSLRRAKELYDAVIAEADPVSVRDLAIKGDELEPLGITGRQISPALSTLLSAVMRERCKNDKNALIQYIKDNPGEFKSN